MFQLINGNSNYDYIVYLSTIAPLSVFKHLEHSFVYTSIDVHYAFTVLCLYIMYSHGCIMHMNIHTHWW